MERLPDPARASSGEAAPKKNQGEAHPRAVLTDEQVRTIKTSHLSPGTLAQAFGISRSHVTNIRAGRRWPHLDVPEETGTQPRPEEDADGSR